MGSVADRNAGPNPRILVAAIAACGIAMGGLPPRPVTASERGDSLEILCALFESRGDIEGAIEARGELASLRADSHGESDWRAVDSTLAVARMRAIAALAPHRRAAMLDADRRLRAASALRARGAFCDALEEATAARETYARIAIDGDPAVAAGIHLLARIHESLGDYARAEPLYHDAIAARERILGERHPEFARTLNDLANLHYAKADFANAESLYRRSMEIRKTLFGDRHGDYAASLHNLALLYDAMGDYGRAEPLALQALDILKATFGDRHPSYATGLNNLASHFRSMGDYARAESLYQEALAIRKDVLGQSHPDTALSVNNLGVLYYLMGDYGRAEPLYRQAMMMRRASLGERHRDYAASLNNLALLYDAMADYAQAEPLGRQARDVLQATLGEKHPSFATGLNNLAGIYRSMGDYTRAEPLYRRAMEIRAETLGEKHPDYALSLNNLGVLYYLMGDLPRAEPLYLRAMAIRKDVLGDRHRDYAASLNNLALLYGAMNDFGRAEPLGRQARDALGEALGPKHPSYAAGLNNLASLYRAMGEPSRAEPLLREAIAIRKGALGGRHPDTALSLDHLATALDEAGRREEAEPLLREAMEIARWNLELASSVQSQRQQLAMVASLRKYLDHYLSHAASGSEFGARAYEQVLQWKGEVFLRQREARAATGDPAVADIHRELRSTTRRLATLTLGAASNHVDDEGRVDQGGSKDESEQAGRHVEELMREKERLEAELSRRSAAYRAARKPITAPDIASSLPPGGALVDFLEFERPAARGSGTEAPTNAERRLIAFVIRRGHDPVMADLGAMGTIAEDIETWRRTYGRSEESHRAGHRLRERIWTPLDAHLAGVDRIFVSPDGTLGRFPFPALPGAAPGTYLIEERLISVLPVAQALVTAAPARDSMKVDRNLLLIGGVDYDADPGRPGPSRPKKRFGRPVERGSERRSFHPLDGTLGELAAIEKMYEDTFGADGLTTLRKSDASENRFWIEAPRHLYVHVATHGFFASEGNQAEHGMPGQDTRAVPPGIRSGLALAGANGRLATDGDDGILTADEVEMLDLQGVELVMLSACETGLGDSASGEGLLGLQRAFQIAGAQSVVATLWKVDDERTRALMERFYRNIWERDLGKLEALREAQLWMLKEGPTRGVEREPREGGAPIDRSPPYYWAAFVLSGDGR
ncbi:MAG: tetratricopeptide repeat protein [Planctomycetes bacterium]|nr:tetratricopeptide repeat protein [Planctomycetota bacterium]